MHTDRQDRAQNQSLGLEMKSAGIAIEMRSVSLYGFLVNSRLRTRPGH